MILILYSVKIFLRKHAIFKDYKTIKIVYFMIIKNNWENLKVYFNYKAIFTKLLDKPFVM